MRGIRFVHLAAAAVLLAPFAAPAYSGTIRDDRSDSLYLGLGAAPEYASVGRVDGATRRYSFLASGTLIAPDWVLTAAHVVKDATSLNFTVGGTTYTGTSWVAHKEFKNRRLGAGYDIGLIHLDAPVENITPATRYTGYDELGNVATAVGYGTTGTGLTGAITMDFQKRAGLNMVDNFYHTLESTPNIILMDFDQPGDPYESSFGSALPLDLEYLCAPGDSGGGLFADLGFGEELIGVHSFGWGLLDGDPNADYGDASGDTRVSVFNSWIDGAMDGQIVSPGNSGGKKNSRANFVSGDYEFGYIGNVTIPEPSTLALLTMAALGMLTYVWRRRRT